MFMLTITKKIYISELSFGNWDLSSLPVSQTEGREWTCLPQIYDVSDGQSLGWISAVSHNPMQMSKTERRGKRREEKRERESQFREFPLSATRASQDRRFYGRTSKRRSGRIPLSGSPKWPEMRGSHADSEPVPSSDRLHTRVNSKRSSSRKRFT